MPREMTDGSGDQWKGHRIDKLVAICAINEEGDEGIVAMGDSVEGALPMIASSEETVELMIATFKTRPKGQDPNGQRFEVRTYNLEQVEEIE